MLVNYLIYYKKMTEKDKKLLEKADLIEKQEGCIAWYKVSDLEKEAESEDAKESLHTLATYLYHKEEYYAGLL